MIRPMHSADLPAVLALWRACPGIGLNDCDHPEALGAYLQRNPDCSQVVLRDGRLGGAALAGHDGRRGYLHHVGVAPGLRGCGLGRRLVQACLQALARHGMRRVHIFVYADNTAGQDFWSHIAWYRRSDVLIMSHDDDVHDPAPSASPPRHSAG
ncbi:MAG: GNAT family N-acetyltransferase [Planctomycetota bacterium]